MVVDKQWSEIQDLRVCCLGLRAEVQKTAGSSGNLEERMEKIIATQKDLCDRLDMIQANYNGNGHKAEAEATETTDAEQGKVVTEDDKVAEPVPKKNVFGMLSTIAGFGLRAIDRWGENKIKRPKWKMGGVICLVFGMGLVVYAVILWDQYRSLKPTTTPTVLWSISE